MFLKHKPVNIKTRLEKLIILKWSLKFFLFIPVIRFECKLHDERKGEREKKKKRKKKTEK